MLSFFLRGPLLLFKFFSHIGLSGRHLSSDEEAKIVLTNQICLVLILAASPYFFVFGHFGAKFLSLIILPIVLILLMAFFCNSRGWFFIAKLIVISVPSVGSIFYASALGIGAGIQNLFMAMITVPFVVFEFKKEKQIAIGLAIPFVSYLFLELSGYGVATRLALPLEVLTLLRITIAGVTSFITLTTIGFYFYQNKKSKLDIEVAHQSLQNSHLEVIRSNTKLTSTLEDLTKSNALVQSLAQQATLGAIIRGITHEVKGPLTAIQACCSVILLSHNPSPEIKENVEDMLECIVHLGELTKTLLADSGAVVWADSPLNLYRIIDQVIKLVDNEAFTNKIVIEKEIPHEFPMVKGSAAYVSQAILNLLLNALQYTPRNGKIRVWIGIEEDYVKIYVRDSGPGIDPLVKETLFEQGVTTAKPGSSNVGLGLHFVKRVMDAHKGFISVHESSEKGTTFMMVLPIEKESVQAIH